MADATVIQEFLAELGFKVDQKTLTGFTKALKGGATQAVAFGTVWGKVAEEAVKAAQTIVQSVLQMAQQLDTLYFASRRLGDSAENIQAYGYAMSQLGENAQTAQQALEGFHEFLRKYGASAPALLAAIGVVPDPTDIAETRARTIAALQRMDPRQAEARRGLYGISEQELTTFDYAEYERHHREYLQQRRLMGLGGTGPGDTEAGHRFEESMRGMTAQIDLMKEALASALLPYFEQFAHFLENLPGYVQQFQQTGLGRIFTQAYQALLPLIQAIARFVVAFYKLFGPMALQLAKGWARALGDALHFLTDVFNGFANLLSGNWSAAWKDFQSAGITALRFIAHAFEGVILAAIKFWETIHPQAKGATAAAEAFLNRTIDQYLPDTHPAGAQAALPAGAGLVTPAGGYKDTFAPEGAGGAAPPSLTGGVDAAQAGVGGRGMKVSAAILRGVGATVEAFMLANGVPASIAKGIAQGVMGEGGAPNARNPTSGAYGIGQWLGSRKARFAKMFGHPLEQSTFGEQLSYLLWELRGGDRGGAAVLSAGSVAQAAYNYAAGFMRPDLPGQGHAQALGDVARGQRLYLMSPGAGGGNVDRSVNMKADIKVSGVSDPGAAAHHVERAVRRVHSDVGRHLATHVA